MCDAIIILDRLDKEKSHVFYSQSKKQYELTYEKNITFFKGVMRLFNQTKPYIEDTEEEVGEGKRLSEDYVAHIIRLGSFEYKKLVKEATEYHASLVTSVHNFYSDKNNKLLPETDLNILNEFGNFLHFLRLFEELTDDDYYQSYSYYFYTEK
ncbi:hypothetical protein ACORBP_004374 [Vibrio vulnificus]